MRALHSTGWPGMALHSHERKPGIFMVVVVYCRKCNKTCACEFMSCRCSKVGRGFCMPPLLNACC